MDLSASFEPIRAALRTRNMPGIEEGLSYGTPAMKARGKLLLRLLEENVVVLPCELEEKEVLLQLDPDTYFETDHYTGWPWILAYISKLDPEELTDRIERAWRKVATKKMLAEADLHRARRT